MIVLVNHSKVKNNRPTLLIIQGIISLFRGKCCSIKIRKYKKAKKVLSSMILKAQAILAMTLSKSRKMVAMDQIKYANRKR